VVVAVQSDDDGMDKMSFDESLYKRACRVLGLSRLLVARSGALHAL